MGIRLPWILNFYVYNKVGENKFYFNFIHIYKCVINLKVCSVSLRHPVHSKYDLKNTRYKKIE